MLDFVLDDGAGLALDTQGKSEILVDGHMWIERIALKHHANIALARREIVDDTSVEAQYPTGRGGDSGQHPRGGRLCRSPWCQQGRKSCLGDGTTEIMDCWDGAEILRNPFEGDSSHGR